MHAQKCSDQVLVCKNTNFELSSSKKIKHVIEQDIQFVNMKLHWVHLMLVHVLTYKLLHKTILKYETCLNSVNLF